MFVLSGMGFVRVKRDFQYGYLLPGQARQGGGATCVFTFFFIKRETVSLVVFFPAGPRGQRTNINTIRIEASRKSCCLLT